MRVLVFLTAVFFSASAIADISQLKLELLLAERGDLSAQFRVATAYEHGGEVKKDIKESFKWYLKAANQSHAPSQYKVGYFYENALGTAKDMDEAILWYKKAKQNGSDKASHRLDKTAHEKNTKAIQTKRLALQTKLDREDNLRKARANKKAAKEKKLLQQQAKAKKQEQKPAKKVASKKTETKKKKIVFKVADLVKIVLNNKWKNKHGAADYLPSVSTACLASGNNELTCFSSEKSRKINGAKVTYTTKSTLVGFKPNGSFKIIYNYNGISVSGVKSNASDIYGLTMKAGWQEPAIAIKCKASDRKHLSCYRGSKKITFHY